MTISAKEIERARMVLHVWCRDGRKYVNPTKEQRSLLPVEIQEEWYIPITEENKALLEKAGFTLYYPVR